MKVQTRLAELDSLRGIAAMMVVAFHFTLGLKSFHGLFIFGYTGVDLFFMISGFVIILTIEKAPNYKTFLLSRFARLYPAYWVCVTLSALTIATWSSLVKVPITFGLSSYAINLTMFQYYFKVKDIDGVYWTLIIELLFYLFIVVIYLFKKLQHIETIGLFVVLICLVYLTILQTFLPLVFVSFAAYFPLVNYFPLFIAGIVFYKIKFYKLSTYRVLILALCLITQILLLKSTGRSQFMPPFYYVIIVSVFFAFFFLYFFNALQFIVNRATLFLGKISYSLYLIHYTIGALLITVFTHSRFFHFTTVVAVLVTTAIILIVATLINKFIEMPATKYLKRKLLDKG
jgi:peptidoglycan/LPS O-acetylase OafA/YrhL